MKYPWEKFKQEFSTQLKQAIKRLYNQDIPLSEISKSLEGPKDEADLAYPCYLLSKKGCGNPMQIALQIADIINKSEWVEKNGKKGHTVESAKIYVNAFMNTDIVAKHMLPLINEMGDDFGKLKDTGKSVIVEHTSANPNGPLHVGRARNPILGDTIARLLIFGGYDVTTQYYVDDMGKQVAILYWGMQHLNYPITGKKADHVYVQFYQQAISLMEQDKKVAEEISDIVKQAESGNKEVISGIRTVYLKVLEGMLESLRMLKITVDEFVEESQFIFDGSTDLVIDALSKSVHAGYEGNALYLDLEPFGIHGRDKKFFITREDGTSLYATRDVAYHIWKGNRADFLINILGEDHKLEASFVDIALHLLKKKRPETIFYSFVSLPEGKMSTRRGRVVYLDDLISEAIERARKEVKQRRGETDPLIENIAHSVALGAIRYNIIKLKAEKHIVFKWEDALNFEGQSAPFIQYAHARCCSILRKKRENIIKNKDIYYPHKSEQMLIKTIALFPVMIAEGVKNRNPSILAEYTHLLASTFNAFYRDCRVLGDLQENERLALVSATRQILKNALSILGIDALEEM